MATLYTVGYEGTDIDRFIATLKSVGVKVVADVRALAISRKKGFSKSALSLRLKAEGIDYIHFVELGDPKTGRDAARAGKYEQFQRIYRRHLAGEEAQGAVKKLAETVQRSPTALLCFERDPKVCHRSIVAEESVFRGMSTLHLFADDPDRYVRNAAKLSRRHTREGATPT